MCYCLICLTKKSQLYKNESENELLTPTFIHRSSGLRHHLSDVGTLIVRVITSMSVTMDQRKSNVSKIHVKYGPICVSNYIVNEV